MFFLSVLQCVFHGQHIVPWIKPRTLQLLCISFLWLEWKKKVRNADTKVVSCLYNLRVLRERKKVFIVEWYMVFHWISVIINRHFFLCLWFSFVSETVSQLHKRLADGDKGIQANTVTSQFREDSMDAIQPVQSQNSPLSVPSNPASRESVSKDEVCIC